LINLESFSSKFTIQLGSRVWNLVIGIIFIPIYIRFIGEESYGLVAFYATLVGSLAILDLGLSTAISRQLARMQVDGSNSRNQHDLLFSIEIIYWIVGLLTGFIIFYLSNFIATSWLNTKTLEVAVVEKVITIMGFLFAIQFPISVYNGALIGLEKQNISALLNTLFQSSKAIGVIAVLYFISSTLYCYFIWQVIVTLFFTILYRFFVWRALPKSKLKAIFSWVQLKNIWRFAAGMAGISLVTFFLSQIDKLIVSKFVTLDFVGYYSIAFLVGGGIRQIVAPIRPIIFPKFSALVAEKKEKQLIALYHKFCRWVSILVLPIGCFLFLYAEEILFLWTNNETLTLHTTPIMKAVVIGTVCNTMMIVPYILLLAKGNTKYPFYQNLIAAILTLPSLFFLVKNYGALGGGINWIIINSGYLIISIPLIHWLYIKGEFKKWLIYDLGKPLLYVISLSIVMKSFEVLCFEQLGLLQMMIILVIGINLYISIIPEIRNFIWSLLLQKIKATKYLNNK